jgi:hypothetical protein
MVFEDVGEEQPPRLNACEYVGSNHHGQNLITKDFSHM